MDKKFMFPLKFALFAILATVTFNVYAGYCKCVRDVYPTTVLLSGPDCNGYYVGSNCTVVKKICAHWDPYGNYVPTYWLAVNK